MHVLVIDQCSGSKRHPDWFEPFDAETIDRHSLEELRRREKTPTYPARDLYTGRQQQYIDAAVDRLREAGDTVDRVYISAGFGLVDESTELPPYEVTFKDYTTEEIRDRAAVLDIEEDLLNHLDADYDLVFFALGADYYGSIDIDRVLNAIDEETMVVLFNLQPNAEGRPNVVSIPARTDEASEQGVIVVALKGHYLKQFAAHRSRGATIETVNDLVDWCTTDPTEQSGLDEYS